MLTLLLNNFRQEIADAPAQPNSLSRRMADYMAIFLPNIPIKKMSRKNIAKREGK